MENSEITQLKEELATAKSESIITLWKLYNSVSNKLSELLGRTNNIVGEYAEFLANNYLKGDILSPSNRSSDIKDLNGKMYQIKARKVNNTVTQLSVIRSWDFDYLIVILFNFEGEIFKVIKSDAMTAKNIAVYNEHQNGWVITTSDYFFNQSGNQDLTIEFSKLNLDNIIKNKSQQGQIESRILFREKPQIKVSSHSNNTFSKKEAFNLLAYKHRKLTNSNSTFSSPNKSTGNWWLEPNIEKFKRDLYIILYDDKNKKLHFFCIPSNSIANPEKQFYFRKEKDAVSINIPYTEKDSFYDSHMSFSFNKFFIETLDIN